MSLTGLRQNVAFNSALKLSTSIRKDLAALSATTSSAPDGAPAAPSTAAVGSLSASLTAFSRTIDEYKGLAKQEINPAKQEESAGSRRRVLQRADRLQRRAGGDKIGSRRCPTHPEPQRTAGPEILRDQHAGESLRQRCGVNELDVGLRRLRTCPGREPQRQAGLSAWGVAT